MAFSVTASQVTVVAGIEGTGKTAWLCDRVASLRAEGVEPARILLFAASPDAVIALRHRLAGLGCADVRVTTPAEYALQVAADPRVVEYTGRKARMLARYEESFLMEDLKVCGMDPKRIGGMLNFFLKGWEDFRHIEDGWLLYRAEEELHALVKRILGAYRAYHPCELMWCLADVLQHMPAVAADCGADYVFVDDFTYLSRSGQVFVTALAKGGLYVAANDKASTPVVTPYPNGEGLEELLESVEGAVTVGLTESALPAEVQVALANLDALCAANSVEEPQAQFCGETPEQKLAVAVFDSAEAECGAAVDWIAQLVESGVSGAQIACATPNRTWERNIGNMLERRGIAVRRSGDVGNVGGDIRYFDLSYPAQVLTLLTLLADGADEVALRVWCGIGEYLTNRSLFDEIYKQCEATGMTLRELLDCICLWVEDGSLAENPAFIYVSEARNVAQRMQKLAQAAEATAGLTGMALVDAVARFVQSDDPKADGTPKMIQGLAREVQASDDIATVAAKLGRNVLFPSLCDGDGVALVTPQGCLGLDCSYVVCTGLVNGFTPSHRYFDRTKTSPEKARTMLVRESMRFRPVLGSAAKGALFTWIERIRATDASMLNLRSERFFIADGVRYSRLSKGLVLQAMEGEQVKIEL